MEDKITMSKKELERSAICQRVLSKEILVLDAAKLMHVSYRQSKRIVKRYRNAGGEGLIHGNRGTESGRKTPGRLEKQIVSLYEKKYSDFKPTFFNEKLEELHKIKISTETVRKILIKNDKWKARKEKGSKNCHVWREPKSHVGEMIQFDGSHHRWLEDRLNQEICLMGFIDDANNEIFAKFYEYEGTFPVLDSFQDLIKQKGIPMSVYIDKHSTYKTTRQATIDEQLRNKYAKTQFERVMHDIGTEVIFAHSPQAKGRIERLFSTLQDRLVKELRLAKIKTIHEANIFLKTYLPIFNKQFGKEAKEKVSYFKSVPKDFDYKWTFAIRDQRTIANDFTVRWNNRLFLIKNQTITLKKQKIQIKQSLTGELRFETKDKIIEVKEITEKAYGLAKKAQQQMIEILKKKADKKSKKSWMDDLYIGNSKSRLVA